MREITLCLYRQLQQDTFCIVPIMAILDENVCKRTSLSKMLSTSHMLVFQMKKLATVLIVLGALEGIHTKEQPEPETKGI